MGTSTRSTANLGGRGGGSTCGLREIVGLPWDCQDPRAQRLPKGRLGANSALPNFPHRELGFQGFQMRNVAQGPLQGGLEKMLQRRMDKCLSRLVPVLPFEAAY